MRPALLLGSSLLIASLAAACGGSASESPWPVEPDGVALGPAGESSAAPAAGPIEGKDGGPPSMRAE